MNTTLEQANRRLFGFTNLLELRLRIDPETGSYELNLTLENAGGAGLKISFDNVSGFSLGGFHGEFMGLHLRDVRSLQWDRINYELVDREHVGDIFLRCRGFKLSDS